MPLRRYPEADAKMDDITGLLGGGLFQPLFKWMNESGPVYLLPTGPVTSYVVVSDPDCIKQVLFNYGSKYIKGTIAEAGEFLFGLGVALQENEAWKIRRKAVAPSLHRRYVEAMVDRCFGPCAERMVDQVTRQAEEAGGRKERLNLESKFSQAALDIIGGGHTLAHALLSSLHLIRTLCIASTRRGVCYLETFTSLKGGCRVEWS